MFKRLAKNESFFLVGDKKVHPFLFLIAIFVCCLIIFYAWLMWIEKAESKRLKEIVQSNDIARLLTGEEFTKKEFSKELETIKQAHTKERQIKNSQLADVVKSFTDVPDFTDESIGLAMKGINISQGTNGREEWALSAKWATMREESSIVQVEKPVMWHRAGEIGHTNASQFLADDSTRVELFAERGLVYDNNQKVLLQENVTATQEQNRVEGDILSYDSEKQIAVFPNKATFTGEGIQGVASVLSWNMLENKMYGSGKVEVIWTPEEQRKK